MRARRRRPLAAALLVCSLFLGACGAPTGNDALVYIFVDLTEIEENDNDFSHLEKNVDPLLDLLGHGERGQESRAGADVQIFPIYDFSLNRPESAHLERGTRNQNALDRRDAVGRFEEQLRQGLLAVVETHLKQRPASETYRQSHIFGPLCEGLKEMQRRATDGQDKRVVIFSDMLENSPIASIYSGTLDTAALDAHCALPDLGDTCMNVVYQPLKKKSALVLDAREFWTTYLADHGLATASPTCFSYDSFL